MVWLRSINTNPFGVSSPLWLLSKILGIAPYEIRSNLTIDISRLNVAFTIGWYIFYWLACMYSWRYTKADSFPNICKLAHIMHTFLGFFQCTLCYALVFTVSRNIVTFIVPLRMVDDRLAAITRSQTSYERPINQFLIKILASGGVIYLLLIVWDGFLFYEIFDDMLFITLFCYFFPYVIATIIQCQFVSIVYHIQLRFRMLNKALNHVASVNEITSKAVKMYKELDVQYPPGTSQKNPPTPILFITGNDYVEDVPLKPGETEPTSAKGNQTSKMPTNLHIHMDTLFTLHDKLLDMSENVNNMYAVQIVAFITVAFVIILFGFFFETKVIFWLWGQNTRLILIATSYLLWGILMALVIYTLLTICTRTREEAYESALIVHKILQNKPMFMLNDEIYYNKMKSFTLQILHRKNTFNFNGLGLFQLDYTFIFSAVSAATSYLIVLLQFDLAADLN